MNLDEVNHLLELSRIKIGEEEKKKLAAELGQILQYVEKLKEVDVSATEPMNGGTNLENICRADKVKQESPDYSGYLKKAAPKIEDGYFKIPPIF